MYSTGSRFTFLQLHTDVLLPYLFFTFVFFIPATSGLKSSYPVFLSFLFT